MQHNLSRKTSIAIFGLPRSGTTVTCKFFNSMNRSLVIGEPHRAQGPASYNTKYGGISIDSSGPTVMDQLEWLANWHDFDLYGFKEPWDIFIPINPMHLADLYHIDNTIVMIREPRKNYASCKAIGHLKDPMVFNAMYVMMARFAMEKGTPFILEKFRRDPIMYASKTLGWDISGSLSMKSYIGTGDPYAKRSSKIDAQDSRQANETADIEEAVKIYEEIYNASEDY